MVLNGKRDEIKMFLLLCAFLAPSAPFPSGLTMKFVGSA